MNNKAYKIVMMSKHEIKIEQEELPKVLEAIRNNQPAILKQGIFNPKSYSHIIEDNQREKERETDNEGHYTGKLLYTPLLDIFDGLDLFENQKEYRPIRFKTSPEAQN